MGLGPPTCKKCMLIMGGLGNTPNTHYSCLRCGIDCNHVDSGNLWVHTDEELDIILKDNPGYREDIRKLKDFNKRQTVAAINRHKKRIEEDKS